MVWLFGEHRLMNANKLYYQIGNNSINRILGKWSVSAT